MKKKCWAHFHCFNTQSITHNFSARVRSIFCIRQPKLFCLLIKSKLFKWLPISQHHFNACKWKHNKFCFLLEWNEKKESINRNEILEKFCCSYPDSNGKNIIERIFFPHCAFVHEWRENCARNWQRPTARHVGNCCKNQQPYISSIIPHNHPCQTLFSQWNTIFVYKIYICYVCVRCPVLSQSLANKYHIRNGLQSILPLKLTRTTHTQTHEEKREKNDRNPKFLD